MTTNNFKRPQYQELLERLKEPRRFIQVLAGPRQVGKSTLNNQVLADIRMPYTLENADTIAATDSDWIRRIWASARSKMELGQHQEYLLVIDEIQKIGNWSEYVKREWDTDTQMKVNRQKHTSYLSPTR